MLFLLQILIISFAFGLCLGVAYGARLSASWHRRRTASARKLEEGLNVRQTFAAGIRRVGDWLDGKRAAARPESRPAAKQPSRLPPPPAVAPKPASAPKPKPKSKPDPKPKPAVKPAPRPRSVPKGVPKSKPRAAPRRGRHVPSESESEVEQIFTSESEMDYSPRGTATDSEAELASAGDTEGTVESGTEGTGEDEDAEGEDEVPTASDEELSEPEPEPDPEPVAARRHQKRPQRRVLPPESVVRDWFVQPVPQTATTAFGSGLNLLPQDAFLNNSSSD